MQDTTHESKMRIIQAFNQESPAAQQAFRQWLNELDSLTRKTSPSRSNHDLAAAIHKALKS